MTVWNEATPAGTESPTLGDDRIRETKTALRERLEVDHDFEASESPAFGDVGSTIGTHKKVTLNEQSSDPSTLANQTAIYAKDDGAGNTELYMRAPEDGSVTQLTQDGSTKIRSEAVDDCATKAGAETLENKILTSPTINTPTINTPTIAGGSIDGSNMRRSGVDLVDSNRTITAGTGLAGGGSLAADRTISHAAHTGEVTGSTYLSIVGNTIGMYHLKTAAGSLSGRTSSAPPYMLIVIMQDFCFFPNVRAAGPGGHEMTNVRQDFYPADAVGRFILRINSSQVDYAIVWRYVTASDRPFIYIVRDPKTREVVHCWECEDPPPGYWGKKRRTKDFVPPVGEIDEQGALKPLSGLEEITLFDFPMDNFQELRARSKIERRPFAQMLSRGFEIIPGEKIIRPINLSMF